MRFPAVFSASRASSCNGAKWSVACHTRYSEGVIPHLPLPPNIFSIARLSIPVVMAGFRVIGYRGDLYLFEGILDKEYTKASSYEN